MVRFYGRQSSMAPEVPGARDPGELQQDGMESMSDTIELLCHASKGNVAQVEALLAKGLDVNSCDFDNRTALHVAACEGKKQVVELLLSRGANVNAADRWGSTPLQDARHYNWEEVSALLEAQGGELPLHSPMRVSELLQVPDYEVNPSEVTLTMGEKTPYMAGKWRGTKVFVRIVQLESEDNTKEFVNELSLMLKLRHPNIVQFLGAVTQSIPLMIISEFLPRDDLARHLAKKGAPLKPKKTLKFAFDIARGLNYVHSFKPDPVIHKNLKPSNLLRDKGGHLKVADFAFTKSPSDLEQLIQTSGRYMAPELYRGDENYDTKVDVFSFALIVQEMMEGVRPFDKIQSSEAVAKEYAEGSRPPFKIKNRYYPEGLKELIENCWHADPAMRPTFNEVIKRLEQIKNNYSGNTFKGFITKIRYSRIFGR